MYIVLEYLLLENFIINYLILYLTKVLNRKEAKSSRLVLGAIIASLYSICYFYPRLLFLTTIPFKFILSVLIIRISFKYINFKSIVRELMSFYIISFVFAGASLGLYFSTKSYKELFNDTINYLNIFPAKYLFWGVTLSAFIVLIVFKFYKHKLIRDNFIAEVKINYKGQSLSIRGLIDTGNSLIDPLTNNKVIIIEYIALKDLLPSRMLDLIYANDNNDFIECEKILEELKGQISLSIIPYKSIGKSGMMFCFKPDNVEITLMDNIQNRNDILIGIYSNNLSKEMGYSGLLHYELLNGGVGNGNVEIQIKNILL